MQLDKTCLFVIIIIIIMGLKSVSASKDVIGNLNPPPPPCYYIELFLFRFAEGSSSASVRGVQLDERSACCSARSTFQHGAARLVGTPTRDCVGQAAVEASGQRGLDCHMSADWHSPCDMALRTRFNSYIIVSRSILFICYLFYCCTLLTTTTTSTTTVARLHSITITLDF